MELRRITTPNEDLRKRIAILYESSFPKDERCSTEHFLDLISSSSEMTFNAIVENDEFCGMAVIWELGIFRYLLYLAVESDRRNKGLGSKALQFLQQESELPITGEVERPINEINARRIEFYKRNGFQIEDPDPKILNSSHTYDTCVLQLISTKPLPDKDYCQKRIVDTVYRALHP